jgi:hypothetical protein
MTLVKRIFWLAAWSVWLWLGLGLYRELPRDLGPVVCKLKVKGAERALGFLADGRKFATQTGSGNREKPEVQLWDATNGAFLRTISVPSSPMSRMWPEWCRLSHSCLFGYGMDQVNSGVTALEWAIDLETGRQIDLGECRRAVFHPKRSLAVVFERQSRRILDRRRREAPQHEELRLIDLSTGEVVLSWPDASAAADGTWLSDKPIFVGNDRIAIPASKQGKRHRMEIWKLDELGSAPQIVDGLRIDGPSVGGSERRVAFQRGVGDAARSRVFDLHLGREIFETPSLGDDGEMEVRTWGWEPELRLDSSGRGLLNPNFNVLWDVESGRKLWRGGIRLDRNKQDRPGSVGRYASAEIDSIPPDRFETIETWYYRLGSWSGEKKVWAVRNLRDASLVYRCWNPTTKQPYSSPDGRLVVERDWNVHELPPRVNYPLLALCQTILALPLVLLWAVLRWRGKRRAPSVSDGSSQQTQRLPKRESGETPVADAQGSPSSTMTK